MCALCHSKLDGALAAPSQCQDLSAVVKNSRNVLYSLGLDLAHSFHAPHIRATVCAAVQPPLRRAGIFDEALKDGVRNLNFGGLSTKLGTTMYKYKFRIPPYYTLLVRSLTILEGIALASDPNYKVLGAAYPWVARRLLTDTSPELRATLRRLLYDDSGMFRFDRMESLLEQAVRTPPPPRKTRLRAAPRGQDHIRGAAEGSADAGARSTAASAGALALLLSEEGEYLRGIMLDELAKGVDAAARMQLDEGARTVRAALASVARGETAEVGVSAASVLSSIGGPVASAAAALSRRVSDIPEASDITDRQQVRPLVACTDGQDMAIVFWWCICR